MRTFQGEEGIESEREGECVCKLNQTMNFNVLRQERASHFLDFSPLPSILPDIHPPLTVSTFKLETSYVLSVWVSNFERNKVQE